MALQQLPDGGGVLWASGKRVRRRHDPNEWATSLLTARHNVLCLGMSYPCVDTILANCKGRRPPTIFHSEPSVERSVELTRRKLLTQTRGRDLARVAALEADGDISAYTVSIETGSHYVQRHLHANFNDRTFVEQMLKQWGQDVRFRQVILDYFWCPPGWTAKSWQTSFFSQNIPRFVTENLFNYGDLEKDTTFVPASEATGAEEHFTSTAGVIYLPFCAHCFSMVVAHIDELSPFFTIAFLHDDELDEHTLLNATHKISAEAMKEPLAKEIFQEEIYCKVTAKDIKQGAYDPSLRRAMKEVFGRIPDVHNVRIVSELLCISRATFCQRATLKLARPFPHADETNGNEREPPKIPQEHSASRRASHSRSERGWLGWNWWRNATVERNRRTRCSGGLGEHSGAGNRSAWLQAQARTRSGRRRIQLPQVV